MFNKIYEYVKNFMKENWSFILVFCLILAMVFIKVPYEVEMPGGTIDLGNRVLVNNEETEIEGSFNMAYVSVVSGRIPYILLSFIIPDWDIVPESSVTYENETIEDANKRDKLYLEQSKDYATVVAMDAADIKYEISNKLNYVSYIDKNAQTTLKVGDDIKTCNGKEIVDINEISKIIQETEIGEIVKFKVLRNGKEKEVEAKVYEEDDKHYVGISAITTFDIDSDIEVEIDSKETESGSSGGLMMTLMVYNALTKQDLTNGKKIVGTGTIELDGTVGEIGGVKYKVMGAVKDKADIFFVPEANYEEAIKVKEEKKYDLKIVPVKTLQDAIDYLEGD